MDRETQMGAASSPSEYSGSLQNMLSFFKQQLCILEVFSYLESIVAIMLFIPNVAEPFCRSTHTSFMYRYLHEACFFSLCINQHKPISVYYFPEAVWITAHIRVIYVYIVAAKCLLSCWKVQWLIKTLTHHWSYCSNTYCMCQSLWLH